MLVQNEWWTVETLKVDGRHRAVARRCGITFIIAETADGRWRVTKLKGGRVLDEREGATIPGGLRRVVGGRLPLRASCAPGVQVCADE